VIFNDPSICFIIYNSRIGGTCEIVTSICMNF
jgi:hypothetical protein